MFEFNRIKRLPPYVFAISPGIGFGEGGDDYVRFALVENEHRIRQAVAGIKRVLNK